MKYLIRLALVVFIFSSCTTQRYHLLNKGEDKHFLVNYIRELNDNAEINTYNPLIILDGNLYRSNIELKETPLQISKEDIREIRVMDFVEAIQTYGKQAQGGTIKIVTHKAYNEAKKKPKTVFIFVDGKKVTQKELKAIDTARIKSINRIWNKEEIKKYTDEKCDLIIMITLNKE